MLKKADAKPAEKKEEAPKKGEKKDKTDNTEIHPDKKATDLTDSKPATKPICNGKNKGECEAGTFAKKFLT